MPAAPVDEFDELPRAKGPTLRRFKEGRYKQKIEYLDLLSAAPDDQQSASGGHSHVFKVRIDGELYALKVFKFFNVDDILFMIGPYARSVVSREEVEGQTDPFYAECRAYGRIASKPRKKPIAVACHGFISIPAKQESFLANRFNLMGEDWNRPQEEHNLPVSKQQPFRALVKDLVEETEIPITENLIKSMRRELKSLNSMGVYVMDVRWDNYRGGHVVDFSLAWTTPHFEFRKDVNSDKEIDMNKQVDAASFDKMVKEELEIDVDVDNGSLRAYREPDPDVMKRLRPRAKREELEGQQ